MHPAAPPAVRKAAVDLYRRGHSLREIGATLGLSHNAIRCYVGEAGVRSRRRGGKSRDDLPPRSELLRMRAKFGRWSDVAYVCGCAYRTLMRRVHG